MQCFTVAGLSILCLSLAATTSVKAQNRVEHIMKSETVISRNITTAKIAITPFELVSRAYQGAYQMQGIPGFNTFLNDVSSKKITARDLVKAGIINNQLASETLNDLKYLQAVDFVLSTQKI
jgi:hypothetical protein